MNLQRTVYQVNAKRICQLIDENEKKSIHRSFCQYLYSAWIDPEKNNTCGHRKQLVLTKRTDLIAVAIDWERNDCTAKNIEDFVSIITPKLRPQQLYDQISTDDLKSPLDLIGLICFYGGTLEVFFSYDYQHKHWIFSFDGHTSVLKDWQNVLRKCLDCHLQPFLLIYVNNQRHPLPLPQLFPPRTPECRSAPKDDYIKSEMVMKVMQQQLLKKDDQRKKIKEIDEDSSISSQRDSGLDSVIQDGSSDESLIEHDPQSLFQKSLVTLDQYLDESFSSPSTAVQSCQSALLLIDQLLSNTTSQSNLSIYLRRKKNSFLSRLHVLRGSPKKSVSFSDRIALIDPTADEPLSPSDSEDENLVGLVECTLCHKRCAMDQQVGNYCRNCHVYMQRFEPKNGK